MSEFFSLNAIPALPSEIISSLSGGGEALNSYLGNKIYANHDSAYLARQIERMIKTLELHQSTVGDKPCFLMRAPGRLNAFLEYLDMCAGDHMSATIDGDIPVAISVRDDEIVSCVNDNQLFAPGSFDIGSEYQLFKSAEWKSSYPPDTWDSRTRIHPYFGHNAGEWMNYVRSSFLRVKWDMPDMPFRGADMTFGPGTAPFRAGTSSSSAIVVLSFLTLWLANKDALPQWTVPEVCRLLGEAEWYVGTHGGANDQTTILRNLPNGVLYNRHSLPVLDSDPLRCIEGVRVILADSLWEANKALGANHTFNLRKGWMDLGDDIMKIILKIVDGYISSVGTKAGNKQGWLVDIIHANLKSTPGIYPSILEYRIDLWEKIFKNYKKFGSLASDILDIPIKAIEELIYLLPDDISVIDAGDLLAKNIDEMNRDYTIPYENEGGYKIRSAAIFFYKENLIGRRLETIFKEANDRSETGSLSIDSEEYDKYRTEVGTLLEELQNTIRDDFQVSNSQLDMLLDIAKNGPGYLGGKLTGAGSGGCVSIMIREGYEEAFCRYLDDEYYTKPENFDEYRRVLDSLSSDFKEGSIEYKTADEMKQNLELSLKEYKNRRRAVTFSRGACVIDFRN